MVREQYSINDAASMSTTGRPFVTSSYTDQREPPSDSGQSCTSVLGRELNTDPT